MSEILHPDESFPEVPIERRQGVRGELRALAYVDAEDGRHVMLEVIDVSSTGLRVKHQGAPLGVTERVEIELAIGDKQLQVKGRVANLSNDGAGITFVSVKPEDQAFLERYAAAHADR